MEQVLSEYAKCIKVSRVDRLLDVQYPIMQESVSKAGDVGG